MSKELDLEDQIMLAILPYIFETATKDNWAEESKAGDQWIEQVGFEAYKYARRIVDMKHAKVKNG